MKKTRKPRISKLARELANGDRQGTVRVRFAEPTVVRIRYNFSDPQTRHETVTEVVGYVAGGWGDTFLLSKDDGPYGREVWDITLESRPIPEFLKEDD